MAKLTKRQKKAAGKATSWVRHIAASKAKRPKIKGTFGAASEVRHINPSEYKSQTDI